ncbi:MAG: hypothetical protein CMJ76_05980 [Planctomycetaceae bacterium]|nr:hypothetical protein [Planctomycetaceae bacterium]
MKFARCPLFFCLLFFFSVTSVQADVTIEIQAGEHDRTATPVKLIIEMGKGIESGPVKIDFNGSEVTGQICELGLESLRDLGVAADPAKQCELHFILPNLPAGKKVKGTVTFGVSAKTDKQGFHFEDKKGLYTDLILGDRPVMRYMYEALDTSSKERIGETYKVYHHVYDPHGKRFVTKGAGGLFPHHRGLFYGFNKISYSVDGQAMTADIWHCRSGESQAHVEVCSEVTGNVLGRHLLKIDWKGKDGKPFATELRELSAYNVEDGVMIEFASTLKTLVGEIKLAGDPQHAGFQFRGSQEIPDKTAAQTYYVRPDGKGEPGVFRNWPNNKDHVNLKWNGLCFVLADQRLTCCYLDHPQNPKEARFSERNYGRFGSYFEYTLQEDQPLNLNYRIWLQYEEMTVQGIDKHSSDFVTPPAVTQK